MRKYYIEESPLWMSENAADIWNFLMPVFEEHGEKIAIVENAQDYEVNISGEVTSEPEFVYNPTRPEEIRITRRPFMIIEEFLSVTFHYKLNKDIFREMKTEWPSGMQVDNLLPHSFVIKDNEGKVLFANAPFFKIALLHEREAETLKDMGMNLKEWNVLLNDVI